MKRLLYSVSYYSKLDHLITWKPNKRFQQSLISGEVPENSPYRVLGKYFSIKVFHREDLRALYFFDAILANSNEEEPRSFNKMRNATKLKRLMELSNGHSFLIKIVENFKPEDRLLRGDPLVLRKIEIIIPKVFRLWEESLSKVDSK